MGSLLGCDKKRDDNLLSSDEQIELKLKTTRDSVKRYLKNLENKMKSARDYSKICLKEGKKEKAKFTMKKRKMYETQRDACNGQLSMLEEQIEQVKASRSRNDVLKVIEEGNKAIKKLQEEVSIDKWEAVKEDLDDLKEKQDEIGDFLKENNVEYGEENVEEDLAELEKMIGDEMELPDAEKTKPEKNEQVKQAMVA